MRTVSLVALACVASLLGCTDDSSESETTEVVQIEPTETAAPAPRVEALEGVQVGGLDPAAKEAWLSVVNEVTSPCGEPVSVAACVAESMACRECLPASRYLARLAAEGLPAAELRERFRARYDDSQRVSLEVGDSPVLGAPMAPVTIVEFSDFECPYCARARPILEATVAEFEGKVRLVFKNFPLDGHVHSRLAARAVVAAHAQGKFWPMHDLLFQNQRKLERPDLERYAEQVGLDMTRFRADLDGEASEAAVAADRAMGKEANITGTPSIFINGRPYLGSLDDLGAYIREELER